MNKVNLIGRLTVKPELRYSNGNTPILSFNLAVNRNFTNSNGEREADFITCIAWRKTAELICQYFDKGSQIALSGRIQTGSYNDKDGKKIYTTDVVVDEIYFLDNKKLDATFETGANAKEIVIPSKEDLFAEMGKQIEIDDNDLPF